ncbi:WRKY transcription factor WRKY51-like [Zingiber officinale]|uniref:WRKY domain-containing protein n=1 Tax=Zingiber officinale TaxID=94328 RepID=A0A8J5GK25_ZINOF|nr:WRKY transcription factor WRKY51-like [Zingiber officinale]KAG6508257.1 hypothetical protein ZIOFF_033631 [Zingiber officinale]
MGVDLMGYDKMDDQMAIQEAATAGLRSMEHLIRQLSGQQTQQKQPQVDCREITEVAVSKFKKVISMLNRTGHARFRRGPTAAAPPQPPAEPSSLLSAVGKTLSLAPVPLRAVKPLQHAVPRQRSTLDFTEQATANQAAPCFSIPTPLSSATSSFVSSVTGDGSVSKGRGRLDGASLILPLPTASLSTGKPPLSSSLKRLCHEHGNGHSHSEQVDGKYAISGGRCHCSKRRKSRVKRTIRVPAISSKVADIPPDEFSWRKYGQKPIKGSPYPRGYYKCSTLRGCPARKHVERAPDDPSMLIVTYEGEHRHTPIASAAVSVPETVPAAVAA